jgi:hypothetical protein
MSDASPPETPTKAARTLIGWFAGALAFESVHAYAEGGSISAAFGYGIGAIVVAIGDYKLPSLLVGSPRLTKSLNDIAADARWWVAVAMLSLLVIALSPYIEQRDWPFSGWFQSRQSPTEFTQQQVDEKIAAAAGTLKQQMSQLQSALQDMTRQRDAALSKQQQVNPQSQPAPFDLNANDIATRIVVWKSVGLQMDSLTTILNTGNNLLFTWVANFRADPPGTIGKIAEFANEVAAFRAKMARLRDNYISYPDIADALKETIISGGRPPVPGTIFDRLIRSSENLGQELHSPPQDFEISLTPHVGALKRDLDAVIEWRDKIGRLALDQEKQLSSLGAK